MIKKQDIEQYQDFIARLYPTVAITRSDLPSDFNKLSTQTVTFQVTDDCTLRCTYCYQIHKGHHKMPLEVAKKFIDMLLTNDENTRKYCDTENSKAVILEFIGGEPFMEVDLIEDIYQYFMKKAIELDHPWAKLHRLSICSNGTLYFEPKVQDFIRRHAHHLSFSISIDGNKELHDACRVFPDGSGSYDIAHAAMEDYVEKYQEEMGSKMTLAPGNIEHTFEAGKAMIEDGYRTIHLNCVYEEGWTPEHALIMYNQLKELADYILDNNLESELYMSIFEEDMFRPKDPADNQNWCGGNGAMISVDWKGDIYPCIRYMESSLGDDQEPLIVGNVNRGILTTEEEQKMHKCLTCITRRSQSTDLCFYCPIAEGCAWCTAYNYQVFGTPDARATYICIMHKARALANAYYWNKQYIKNNIDKRFKIWIPDEWALEVIDKNELNMLKDLSK